MNRGWLNWWTGIKGLFKSWLANHKKLGLTFGLMAICFVFAEVWSLSAPTRGECAAEYDVSRGRYTVLAYGLPSSGRPAYARMLKNQYGIELRTVAFCIVSADLVAYADAYNKVSIAASDRKFGHDVFKEVAEAVSKSALLDGQ
jgi:hypothetical protein